MLTLMLTLSLRLRLGLKRVIVQPRTLHFSIVFLSFTQEVAELKRSPKEAVDTLNMKNNKRVSFSYSGTLRLKEAHL